MQELLVDLTDWMKRFSEYFKGDGQQTQILEAKGYHENFLLRCSTQQQSKLPVKSANDSLTVYFTVAFAALPAEPMIPRASDARVGFFTTPILVGGPTQATTVQYVISKWDLARRKQLQYVIDKSVPEIYHETIKKGVMAWNETIPVCDVNGSGEPLLHCVAPGDVDYPDEYEAGDGRHVAIFMTNPSTKGLLGYGPSAVDYRSGEILTASVVLALKSHVKIPSDYSEHLLKQKDSCLQPCVISCPSTGLSLLGLASMALCAPEHIVGRPAEQQHIPSSLGEGAENLTARPADRRRWFEQ
eukprot:symbB.v1.2.026233.t1/scaffold2605.1/size75065/4